MPWTTSPKVMQLRARSRVIDLTVETLDGWRLHLSGRNASVLSLFTFLSIFPLMLAATTILGFVLDGRPELQEDIVEGAAADIPVIGLQLAEDPSSLDGNLIALVVGLAGALWSSTKAFVGLQSALDDVWEVHVDDRAGLPIQRLRALAGIAIIGGAQVGTLVLHGLINAAGLPGIGRLLLLAATALVNVVVVASMYRFLTSASPTYRQVFPGAIGAGIAITALQYFGTSIVDYLQENASDTYGTFAIVLGLITWLGLISIAVLMMAELNAAIVRRADEVDEIVEHDGAHFDTPVRY